MRRMLDWKGRGHQVVYSYPQINLYSLLNPYHFINLYPLIDENTLASHPVTASFIFLYTFIGIKTRKVFDR
jgi:hypothetical protein